jgi:hypothetical protein
MIFMKHHIVFSIAIEEVSQVDNGVEKILYRALVTDEKSREIAMPPKETIYLSLQELMFLLARGTL